MENDFGILISKVWANFDNPIRAMIFQNVLNFLYAALSGGTVLIYVMSHFTFHENVFSLYSYTSVC